MKLSEIQRAIGCILMLSFFLIICLMWLIWRGLVNSDPDAQPVWDKIPKLHIVIQQEPTPFSRKK